MNKVTWSGGQARAAQTALKICLDNKMVKDFFDDTEKEVLQLLLDRAAAGHTIAITDAMQ
jgi:hypothetical protein